MPEIRSDDGRYLLAVQGDGNVVVYDRATPVWDRWSYEAGQPQAPAPPPSAADTPAPPIPSITSDPVATPSANPGRPIRVTSAADGELVPRMYSYWPNAWVDGNTATVFVGHADGRPRFFKVDLGGGGVERLGPRVPYTGTSEGWYWNSGGWVHLCEGPRLRRVHPFSGQDDVLFDISDMLPNCVLWQAHSSDDGEVHSATVQQVSSSGAWPKIGTVVCRNGRTQYFAARGSLDESQVTADGSFLVIKEDDDNRIINLATGEERMLRDGDGAVGHSDCGAGIVVGEANLPEPGACVLWDLRQPLTLDRRRTLFNTWNMGYVALRGERCVHSDATHLSLVDLNTGRRTPVVAHGCNGTDYDSRVKANLDPSGRVACYMTNSDGRFDVWVLPLH
jgi:hypothetical protein